MRRILLVLSVTAVMVLMLVAMAMPPALAFHNPPTGGECGKGQCTGIGDENGNKGATQNDKTGDKRNEACERNGNCWGTQNN
jgi:hypothetical protein